MNKTTPDPGTPIFGELNKELGELPEIDVHDFDSHGFEFPGAAEGAADHEDADGTGESASSSGAAESEETTVKAGGGRRRKEN